MTGNQANDVRAAAEDLIEGLGAYERELNAVGNEFPAIVRLREAIGAALAEARDCVPDWLPGRGARPTTH